MKYHRTGMCGKCGVYLLRNLTNGKMYIGSSYDMGKRIGQHFTRTCVDRYKTINQLYADISELGRDGFDVKCLEECDREVKLQRQKYWYNKLNPQYNMVQPDECPLNHERVRIKALINASCETSRQKHKDSHRTYDYRQKMKSLKASTGKTIRCKSISPDGKQTMYDSLSDAARSCDSKASLCSAVSHIKKAAIKKRTAFGYKWEVMPNENHQKL